MGLSVVDCADGVNECAKTQSTMGSTIPWGWVQDELSTGTHALIFCFGLD